jgi:hypothetical protein
LGLSIIPLVFLIFYGVLSLWRPFWCWRQYSVKARVPLLALLGFLLFPFIWSIPKAFITAKMGTMFPKNGGGYVVWVTSVLGPLCGVSSFNKVG